jgi:hypothetical protein
MKRIFTLMLAAAVIGFTACEKEKDPEGKTEEEKKEQEQIVKLKVAATQTSDTLRVPYGGSLDLSAIFSLEQAEGGTVTLSYRINRQPEYAEGNGEYQSAGTVYSVTGSTLASGDVRVPDALNFGDDRIRLVREATLKIEVPNVLDTTFTIIQTDKPALTPVISLDPEITGLVDGNKLVLQTTGTPRNFSASYFTISPIDFGIEDIRVGIGAGDYITMAASGIPRAGGVGQASGTGGYVVAYYKDNTLEQVLRDETLPQAKLYVDVEYVEPGTVVGIELKPEIGSASTVAAVRFYSATSNQRKMPYNFIVLKLGDGSTRAYDSSTDSHFGFLAGNFSEYLEGRTSEDKDHSGWWTYVGLKADPEITTPVTPLAPVGSDISFDITSKEHFGEDGWTVTVATKTVKSATENE